MNLLLDTHAFVWATAQSRLLSPRAAALIGDGDNTVWVSAVSAYEIEFKRRRDPLLSALPADLDEAVNLQGFEWLPLRPAHAVAAGRLPRLSGDPFDRMLAAQALVEQATLLTRDPLVAAYGPVIAW
ncbi:MAG: type II toxin-antitoxin system VapC family toxin [Caulobacteraceae bacterium]